MGLTSLFTRRPKSFNYSTEVGKWWRYFDAKDEKRSEPDVYYLPCNLESNDNINSARMDFTIPQDKHILISVCNTYRIINKDQGILTKKTAYDLVKKQIDSIKERTLQIDGIAHDSRRITSDFFELDDEHKAITDGYWLALEPYTLKKGAHTIYRSACYKDGKQACTGYNITIV